MEPKINMPVPHAPAPGTIPPATDADTEQRLLAMEAQLNKIYISVEKTRKYFFWTSVLTVAFFILPLIGLLFAIPSFLSTYTQANTLGV